MQLIKICLLSLLFLNLITSCKSELSSNTPSPSEDLDSDEPGEGINEINETSAPKLTMTGCIDPNAKDILKDVKFTLCDGTEAQGTLDLSALSSESILSGTTVNGISGSIVLPEASKILIGTTVGGIAGTAKIKLANCTVDGGTSCTATDSYPASNYSNLIPSNIKRGVQIGGISGSKRDHMVCKNGKGIVDATEAPNNGDVNTSWDGVTHGFANVTTDGDATITGTAFTNFHSVGDMITVSGEERQITAITDANNLTVNSAFSTNASLTYTYYSPNGDLSVDDYQNNEVTRYNDANSTCIEDEFIEVTGTDPLSPDDGQVPNGGNYQDWLNIFQDNLTGIYFTNVLSTGISWTQAIEVCNGLNGSTGGTGWQLPTKKTLIQIQNKNIGMFNSAHFGTSNFYWTSTTVSHNARQAWASFISQSNSFTGVPNNKGMSTHHAFCVRE